MSESCLPRWNRALWYSITPATAMTRNMTTRSGTVCTITRTIFRGPEKGSQTHEIVFSPAPRTRKGTCARFHVSFGRVGAVPTIPNTFGCTRWLCPVSTEDTMKDFQYCCDNCCLNQYKYGKHTCTRSRHIIKRFRAWEFDLHWVGARLT